jgi:UDP-2,3-diacylglucosamine hydrolase
MKLPLYFISDVHLNLNDSANEVEKRERLIEFVLYVSKTGGTLFIVGDLFDFWFEYKYVMPKAYFDVLTALNDAKSNGVDLHFIPGNHDCWGREFLDETLFKKVYPEGATLDIKGKRFLICHGDGLLSWDRGYRVLRSCATGFLYFSIVGFIRTLVTPSQKTFQETMTMIIIQGNRKKKSLKN